MLVPIESGGRVPLDQQVADLALGQGPPLLVHDAGLVTRHDLPRAPGAHLPDPVRDEDVEQLRGADAVQDLQAESVLPAVEDGGRQRFSGRDADPHRFQGLIQAARPLVLGRFCLRIRQLEHGRVQRRDPVEDGGPIRRQDLEHLVGQRPPRIQDRGSADVEREVQVVSEPVGEEELGGRKGDVLRPDAQDRAGVQFGAVDHVVVQVHRPLGKAGAPRRVQPEGDIIPGRVGRLTGRGLGLDQLRIGHEGARRLPHHHDVADVREAVPEGAERFPQRLVDHQHLGPAVLEHVLVIDRPEHGVHGDGDRPDLDGAKEGGHELRAVQQEEGDPVLHLHLQGAEGAAEAVHRVGNLLVGGGLPLVVQRGLAAPPRRQVAVHEVGGDVELLWEIHPRHTHLSPPLEPQMNTDERRCPNPDFGRIICVYLCASVVASFRALRRPGVRSSRGAGRSGPATPRPPPWAIAPPGSSRIGSGPPARRSRCSTARRRYRWPG